jgi:hypothetical protein
MARLPVVGLLELPLRMLCFKPFLFISGGGRTLLLLEISPCLLSVDVRHCRLVLQSRCLFQIFQVCVYLIKPLTELFKDICGVQTNMFVLVEAFSSILIILQMTKQIARCIINVSINAQQTKGLSFSKLSAT